MPVAFDMKRHRFDVDAPSAIRAYGMSGLLPTHGRLHQLAEPAQSGCGPLAPAFVAVVDDPRAVALFLVGRVGRVT
jgi:hypothetical protein